MKEKLARKYVRTEHIEKMDPQPSGENSQLAMVQITGYLAALERAYVAGFERAKALCIDHVARSVDERIDPSYQEASGGRLPSEVLAFIGEN